MRGNRHEAGRVLLAALLLAFPLQPLFAQPGQVFATMELQADTAPLSGSIRVTLALEGPAPLRVELPKEAEKLLAPQSAQSWQIRPLGEAKVQMIEGGRGRWERHYRFSPFVPGDKVPIQFLPVRVQVGTELNPREVAFPSRSVRVQTSLNVDEAKAEDARPATGIETLPPIAPRPGMGGWQFVAMLGAVFFGVLFVVLLRRSRAQPPPAPPGQWAVRELSVLERESAQGSLTALSASDRLAGILREYIERRRGLDATKRTTAELLAELPATGWAAERIDSLAEILGRCDLAKYAADPPADLLDLLDQARRWIRAEPPDNVNLSVRE